MTSRETPEPSEAETVEVATEEEEEHLLRDIDRILRGDLPFGALLGLDEDDIHTFADLADEQLAAGRVANALQLYEGCVQLDPLDVTLLCGYAMALRHAGDADRARQITDLILELEPQDPDVRAFLSGTHLVAAV
jgi:predicted Zn-dependent protease